VALDAEVIQEDDESSKEEAEPGRPEDQEVLTLVRDSLQ
jgi:hypothetical protein